jgi:hypothetical protein
MSANQLIPAEKIIPTLSTLNEVVLQGLTVNKKKKCHFTTYFVGLKAGSGVSLVKILQLT